MAAWQTIETAPKDGTRILLYPRVNQRTGECTITVARWWQPARAGKGFWIHDGTCTLKHPTHWQPLPAPPSDTDRGTT